MGRTLTTPKHRLLKPSPIAPVQSNRSRRNEVYRFIGDVAEPGDILFVTTPLLKPQALLERLRWRINFTSQGYPKGDYREWGTLVFSHMEKEAKGGNWVPIVLQSKEPQLSRFRLPPGYFRNPSRIELTRFDGITSSARQQIVSYLNDRIHLPHDHSELVQNRITFQTGLPNFCIRHDMVNCVRTTMEAYASAGLLFSHRCNHAAYWNYARYLGRPLLHSAEGVRPKYNYLQDHHLYSDPRVVSTGSIFQRNDNFIMLDSPEKFSWVGE